MLTTILILLIIVTIMRVKSTGSLFIDKYKTISRIWDLLGDMIEIPSVTYASVIRTSKLDSRTTTLYFSIPQDHDDDSDRPEHYYGVLSDMNIVFYSTANYTYKLYISKADDMTLYERFNMFKVIFKILFLLLLNQKDLG